MDQGSVSGTIVGQASVLAELAAAAVQTVLEENGVGFGCFDLLSAVQGADGSATQNELARRLGISAPSLSENIKSAVRKGLVEQHGVEFDLRARVVRLTSKGERLLRECLVALEAADNQICRELTPDEARMCLLALKKGIISLARSQIELQTIAK